jgi:uncharacterized protein (DUF1697 family)
MQTYISILRGINVSGHNLIKMKALQEMCGKLGFRNVRTYIQSGNIVFETKKTDLAILEKTISGAIMKSFGLDIPVLVLEKEALKNIEDYNVFINERHEDHTKLSNTFFEKKLEVRATTRNWRTLVELIKLSGRSTAESEING